LEDWGLFRWLTLACLLCVLTTACGGSSGAPRLSDEAYFAQLQTVNDTAQKRFGEITKQLGTNKAEAEALVAVQQVYPEQVATLKDLLSGMEALRPPTDVQKEHNAAIKALRANVALQEKDAPTIAGATTVQQVGAVLSGAEESKATEETSTTCKALEAAAAARGITVKLDC
jgi:hypothetical protein